MGLVTHSYNFAQNLTKIKEAEKTGIKSRQRKTTINAKSHVKAHNCKGECLLGTIQ